MTADIRSQIAEIVYDIAHDNIVAHSSERGHEYADRIRALLGEPVAWGVLTEYPSGGTAWSGIYHTPEAARYDAELLHACVSKIVPLYALEGGKE